jgi:hypothetical protein
VDSYWTNIIIAFGGIFLLAIIGIIVHVTTTRRPPSKLPK